MKKIVPKLEEFYNKFPLNESKLRFKINEVYGQVNNIHEIVYDLAKYLKGENGLGLKFTGKKDNINLYLITNKEVINDFSKPNVVIKVDNFKIKNLYFKIKFKKYYNFINFFFFGRPTESKNAAMGLVHYKNEKLYSINLNIAACIESPNKIYVSDFDIHDSLVHELTHYYNYFFNDNYSSYDKGKKHSKTYNNNRYKLNMGSSGTTQVILYALYFFSDDEIMAYSNELTAQLHRLGINRNNYKESFDKTIVGETYNYVIEKIDTIFSDNTIDWNEIREYLQDSTGYEVDPKNVFDENSILGKTKDPLIFKNNLYKYLMRRKERCWKQFRKSIEFAIDAYQGKDPNKTYSTHNQNITG